MPKYSLIVKRMIPLFFPFIAAALTITNHTNTSKVNCMTLQGTTLWAGTQGGLVEWNTVDKTWKKYTTKEGLCYNDVKAVAVDKKGRVWISAWDYTFFEGISVFDSTDWSEKALPDTQSNNLVMTMAVDDSGNVWFASMGSIFQYNGIVWNQYSIRRVQSFLVDRNGFLWCGTSGDGLKKCRLDYRNDTSGTVTYLDISGMTIYTDRDGLPNNYVTSITEDQSGNIWIGTKNGIGCYNGKEWNSYTVSEGLVGNYVTAMATDSSGAVWIGTADGASCFNGKQFTNYGTGDGLTDQFVKSIVVDSSNTVWIGTGGYFYLFNSGKWENVRINEVLSCNDAYSLTLGRDGISYIGTGSGIFIFDGDKWKNMTTSDGLLKNYIEFISIDRSDRIWYKKSPGVARADKGTSLHFTSDDGLAGNVIYDIDYDGEGMTWIATNDGVCMFDGTVWRSFDTSDGLPANRIRTLAIDEDDNKWFGTSKGITRMDSRGSCVTFDSASGVLFPIRTLHIDKSGRIWGGGSAIVSYSGGKWKSYEIPGNDRSLIYVQSISSNNENVVWFGTSLGGVYRFDGTDWDNFTTGEGILSNTVNDLQVDSGGMVWIATGLGVSSLCEKDDCTFNYSTHLKKPSGKIRAHNPYSIGLNRGSFTVICSDPTITSFHIRFIDLLGRTIFNRTVNPVKRVNSINLGSVLSGTGALIVCIHSTNISCIRRISVY